MSGICVVTGTADAVAVASRMTARMSRYGQRRSVLALGEACAGGRSFHGRLPGDRAPQRGPDGITVLVEGEIFERGGPSPDPAATLAALYRAGRLEEAARLDGSFAAVIVDEPAKRVTLLTDRLASRSLFVWREGGRLSAASRMEALLADDAVPRVLGVQGLAELLSFQRTLADHTQYASVRSLPAARVLTFERGRADEVQTRRLAWRRPEWDATEASERLAAAVRGAVARRTGDSARHGLLLSGGLDARFVLGAARANGRNLCCLTACAWDNGEVALARAAAAAAGAPFRFVENPPASIAASFDAATDASDGLFPAPTNLFPLLPELARNHDVLLSGHGLDYTLRGYYLPCAMLRIAGSVTRLPRLRRIPDGSPETVERNMRVGIPRAALERTLHPRLRRELRPRRVEGVRLALAEADLLSPYDAWDAFILHNLGRHYAYSDFVAMASVIPHRPITFDNELFDIYLAMPPAWRAQGAVAQRAMALVAPDLMRIADANTGFRADIPTPVQLVLVLLRAGLRRAGVLAAPKVPEAMATNGSWANYGEVFRRDPQLRHRIENLPREAALIDCGLFDPSGIAEVMAEHMAARANHWKLLQILLTVASWFSRHGFRGVSWA